MKLDRKRCQLLLRLLTVLVIGAVLVTLAACIRTVFKTEVVNGTKQVLTIYYDEGITGTFVTLGDVEPGEHIYTPGFCIDDGYCQIDAKNAGGEVVFSREYDWWELSDMDWLVVITPPIVRVYEPIDYANTDEYTAFTAEGAVPCFSFEYPSDYKLLSFQPMPQYPSTSVLLSDIDYQYQDIIVDGEVIKGDVIGCPPEAEWDYKHMQIFVYRANEYSPEAEIAVDKKIAEHEQLVIEGWIEDFRLLEKNRVIVAGLGGWEIVISYIDLPPAFVDGPCPRTRAVDVVYRCLFFDYQDTIWEIRMYSDAGNADQAKLDYEHILGTLRIIE